MKQAANTNLCVRNGAVIAKRLHETCIPSYVKIGIEKELMGTSRMIHKEGIDDTHPNQTKPTFRTRHVKINTLVSNSLSHGTEISMHRWHRDSVGYTYSADSDRLEQKWGQHRRSN